MEVSSYLLSSVVTLDGRHERISFVRLILSLRFVGAFEDDGMT